MKSEYFIVLALIIIFPLILSFDRKLALYSHRRALFLAVIGMCVPFWMWDVVAALRGHWWFNELHTVGVSWLGLPVEEWLFFPVVGFVSVFTWESTKYLRRRRYER